MKSLLFLIIFLISLENVHSQTVFNYNYTEVCSGRQNTVRTVLNNSNEVFTVFFFGETRTFSPHEVNDGSYGEWMDGVYRRWSEYYPCQEVLALVQETSKKVAERNSKEFTQPIIIVSSDLAFFSPNEFKVGSGWSETDILTGRSVGSLVSVGNGRIYSAGYFRLNPFQENINLVENYNIVYVNGNWLGNLIHGIYYDYGGDGIFLFNSATFGNMNGFAFQNNGILLGGFKNIYQDRQYNIKGMMVVSYTYYEKVFQLNYWIDRSVRLNPNLTLTYQISPTFGINVTGNLTYRVGEINQLLNFGILSGAKLFF